MKRTPGGIAGKDAVRHVFIPAGNEPSGYACSGGFGLCMAMSRIGRKVTYIYILHTYLWKNKLRRKKRRDIMKHVLRVHRTERKAVI